MIRIKLLVLCVLTVLFTSCQLGNFMSVQVTANINDADQDEGITIVAVKNEVALAASESESNIGTATQGTKKIVSKGVITVSFEEKAGNITVDKENRVITIPVKADVSYAGKQPIFGLPDQCTATLQSGSPSDLNATMAYDIFDGEKTQSWTVTTREVYKNVTAASVLTTAMIFGDQCVLQRDSNVKIWGSCEGAKIVTVEFAGQKRRAEVVSGKWEVTLSSMAASAEGRSLVINAGGTELTYDSVYVGDVWLCSGQSNMDMAVRSLSGSEYEEYLKVAENRKIRFFRVNRSNSVTPLDEFTKTCNWSVPSTTEVKNYSAYAYAYAVALEDELDIPIGIIDSAYGGTNIQEWMTPEALQKAGTSYSVSMYNSMINPIVGLSIKGILWYQGESNVNDATSYTDLFREYAVMYRELFEIPDLPIITTQLPRFLAADYPQWHQFRLTQWEIAENLDNVYIVCGIDLGAANNIHPLDKFVFGSRAADLALNKVYGKNTPAESPYPKSSTLSGTTLSIRLENVEGGLVIKGETVSELYAVGADGIPVPVNAVIAGNDMLEIDVSGISGLKAIYYCYSAVPSGNLYDQNGLPVAPFYLSF